MRGRQAKRDRQLVLEVAKAAYAYVREVDHPIPDGVMIRLSRDHLVDTVNALPYEVRKVLNGR